MCLKISSQLTLAYLSLEPKPKYSRNPWESVAAKLRPSGAHLQSNTAPWPWPWIWNIDIGKGFGLAFLKEEKDLAGTKIMTYA